MMMMMMIMKRMTRSQVVIMTASLFAVRYRMTVQVRGYCARCEMCNYVCKGEE